MASKLEKTAGLAGQGFAIGGVPGAAIGAGLGLIFGNSDRTPEIPDFQFSPEALRSMNFSDLDIESMNPELFKKLQQNDLILGDLRQALASRREGQTANEQRQTSDYLNAQASGQSSNGLAGTPIGNAMMADSAARLYDASRDRAFQEYMALQQGVAGQANANLGYYSGAQNQLMSQFNQNRGAALQQDQIRNGREMARFADNQETTNANTNFYGSLLNGGLQMAAGQQYRGSGPLLGNPGDWGSNVSNWFNGPIGPNTPSPNGYTANHGAIPNWQQINQPQQPQYGSPGGMGYGGGMHR